MLTLIKEDYTKQRNLCVKLLRITKRKYYANLNIKKIKDSRTFWKTIRPLFSDKIVMQQNMTLLENATFNTDDSAIANIFNELFSNIVPNLQIIGNEDILINTIAIDDPIKRAILEYTFHPSVLKIKDMVNIKEMFSFAIFSQDDIATIIKTLIHPRLPRMISSLLRY